MTKTAVITGGNKGIGLEVTRLLVDKGIEVCVVARDFSSFPLSGKMVRTVAFDLARVEDIPALVRDIGDIDILVNNAGVMYSLPFDAYPREKSDMMIKVNLEAPEALIRETGASMARRGGGRIVNNASVAGQIGHPDIWYGVTKAGLINMTKSYAKILGGKGVVVNAVAPGPTDTDMLEVIPLPRREAILKAVHTGRFARAVEVAEAIVWLATDSPEYINGTCIDINNGAFPR